MRVRIGLYDEDSAFVGAFDVEMPCVPRTGESVVIREDERDHEIPGTRYGAILAGDYEVESVSHSRATDGSWRSGVVAVRRASY